MAENSVERENGEGNDAPERLPNDSPRHSPELNGGWREQEEQQRQQDGEDPLEEPDARGRRSVRGNSRRSSNSSAGRPPDFAGWAFKFAREGVIEKGHAVDHEDAAGYLYVRWLKEKQRQEGGSRERASRERGTPMPQRRQRSRDASAAPEGERSGGEKEKSKGKTLPKIPRGVPPPQEFLRPILPYARSRLKDLKHVGLFYFTEEGLRLAVGDPWPSGEDSVTLSQNDAAITLSTAPKIPKNAKQDENLSWDQVSKAKAIFLLHAKAEGWPEEHLQILALFFLALDNHPVRSEPLGNEVAVRYQAQYRRQWHIAMDQGKPFDLSIIDEQALKSIRAELLQEQSIKAQEQIARAMQALEVEHVASRTPKRRRAASPEPPTPSKRQRAGRESDEEAADNPGDGHQPLRTLINLATNLVEYLPSPSLDIMVKTAPHPVCVYKLRPSSDPLPTPLPTPETSRVCPTPAERFETALFEGDRLGLERLKGLEHLENINMKLSVVETKGAVDGIFQDNSNFKLWLRLRPNMFMSPLEIVLDDWTGYERVDDAPSWIIRLRDLAGMASARVRSYHWVQAYVWKLLTTPYLQVPYVKAWGDVLRYIVRIKSDYVVCHCNKCQGTQAQPRSTRDGHYSQERRDTSTKRYAKIKDLRKDHMLARLTSKRLTVHLKSGKSDSSYHGRPVDDLGVRREDAPPGASASPAAAGCFAGEAWAFVPTPASHPDDTLPGSLSVAPLVALSAAHAPLETTEDGPSQDDVPVVHSVTYNIPEAIGDEEWVDVDDNAHDREDVVSEPPIPSVSPPNRAQAVSHDNIAPSATSASDNDAMASLHHNDPFLSTASAPSTRWSAWSISQPSAVLAMLLVVWLHLVAHLPYRFCDVTLAVINLILVEAGRGQLVPRGEGRRGRSRKGKKRARPYLQTPAKSITQQLAELLLQPHMVAALTGWRTRSRLAGWLRDFFDGDISKGLLGPDGAPFFRRDLPQDPDGEIRVGLALGVDWFSYLRSLIAPSYTSCPMSFSIHDHTGPQGDQSRSDSTLFAHPRQRALTTLKLKATARAFTVPGFPVRTDSQHRRLMEGYRTASAGSAREKYATAYATRWSELARLPYFDMCRMVVVDPMHNLFLGVVKTHFYHIWVQLKVFRKTKEIHRLHSLLADLSLPSKLGRLPRLIGEPAGGSLTADQWLILATTVAPLALPQLWEDVRSEWPCSNNGDKAFLDVRRAQVHASLAARRAQQTKRRRAAGSTRPVKVTVQKSRRTGRVSIVIPPPNCEGAADEASEPSRRSTRSRKPTQKAKDLVLDSDDEGAQEVDEDDAWFDEEEDDEDDSMQASALHPRDLTNFMKLCSAVKLFLADSINDVQLKEADKLIREYCLELVELYGPEVIRPNHHYATHTAEFVRDYGPLREFWTFLFERLNKILKGYRTNNHEGGEIEATFFREFHRSAQLRRILSEGLAFPSVTSFGTAAHMMMQATADNRGTLQQLAEELDDSYADDAVILSLSPSSSRGPLPTEAYFAFVLHMSAREPLRSYHSDIAVPKTAGSRMLPNVATSFDYVVIAGHRYSAALRATSSINSLALMRATHLGKQVPNPLPCKFGHQTHTLIPPEAITALALSCTPHGHRERRVGLAYFTTWAGTISGLMGHMPVCTLSHLQSLMTVPQSLSSPSSDDHSESPNRMAFVHPRLVACISSRTTEATAMLAVVGIDGSSDRSSPFGPTEGSNPARSACSLAKRAKTDKTMYNVSSCRSCGEPSDFQGVGHNPGLLTGSVPFFGRRLALGTILVTLPRSDDRLANTRGGGRPKSQAEGMET
ncbi:hypothetical protein C8Q77DRAFT_1073071 [Trametes polyzona]|nr:hypothetical protein C8Q77DRAFT_1073071 [Trametes polyzona]